MHQGEVSRMPRGKSSQSEKESDSTSSKENDRVKNKTSIVYDTESEVCSQIKAQKEKQGDRKKSKKKKNALAVYKKAIGLTRTKLTS